MTDTLAQFARKPQRNRTPPLPAAITPSPLPREGQPAVTATATRRTYQINALVEPAYGALFEQLKLHYAQLERRKLRGSDILERAILALRREAGI